MPKTRTIKTGRLYRSCTLERGAINQEARTIELSFSSEASVERWFGSEILDHNPASVRLGRLNDGGPLLLDHDTRQQIGVIEQAVVGADRKSRAVVRFGKSPLADEVFQDVLDGIRRNVSVGYQIHQMVLEEEKKGNCTYRATDWEPYEVSIVPVPADNSVGVGRGEGEDKQLTVKVLGKENEEKRMYDMASGVCTSAGGQDCLCGGCPLSMYCMVMPTGGGCCASCGADQCLCDGCPENKNCTLGGGRSMEKEKEEKKDSPVVDITKVRAEALDAERARVREMNAIVDKHPEFRSLVTDFVNNGKPIDDLRAAILEKMGARKVPTDNMSPNMGMSDKDIRRYSLVRAIRQRSLGLPLDGIEKEASDATANMVGREAQGFYIPHEIMTARSSQKRALLANEPTAGGFTVDNEVLGGSMIDLLRNKALILNLGTVRLTGLSGNVLLPKQTGGATAYWLSEDAPVTPSQQTFGQLALKPRRLVAETRYSKELLFQSSLDVEALVRDDIMKQLAIEIDRAAINGLGVGGEPQGILNVTGIGTVTFGAAATWAKIISFETTVATANADVANMAFLTTPASRGKWKGIAKASNYPVYLWEAGANGSGLVNGYRAEATNQVPSDKVIFGNFSDLIFAQWAGIDVVVDPFTLASTGQNKVTITQWTDFGVRHAASFCVSTDSGAQ